MSLNNAQILNIVTCLKDSGYDINKRLNNDPTSQSILLNKIITHLLSTESAEEKERLRELIKELVHRGADINVRFAEGKTCLLKCAEQGQKDDVEMCLDLDADITLTDNQGQTPLHCAMLNKSIKNPDLILKKLCDKGGDKLLKMKDHKGATVVHYAAHNKQNGNNLLLWIWNFLGKNTANFQQLCKKDNDGNNPSK